MDLDLVLEITPEELEEFPEVTETDLVTGVNKGDTGCSQSPRLQSTFTPDFQKPYRRHPSEGGGTHTRHHSHHSPRWERHSRQEHQGQGKPENYHKKALYL